MPESKTSPRKRGITMASRQRVHIGLNVNNVDRSVKFYRAMFGIEPVKWKPGYAKFDIDEPPLNLALNYSDNITDQDALNHLGIEVNTPTATAGKSSRSRSAARNPDLKFLRSNSILPNAQIAARQLSLNDQ